MRSCVHTELLYMYGSSPVPYSLLLAPPATAGEHAQVHGSPPPGADGRGGGAKTGREPCVVFGDAKPRGPGLWRVSETALTQPQPPF